MAVNYQLYLYQCTKSSKKKTGRMTSHGLATGALHGRVVCGHGYGGSSRLLLFVVRLRTSVHSWETF